MLPMKNYRVTRYTYMCKAIGERQARCTCEIDLSSLRRRVFATRIRVGLVSCNGDNAEKVKGGAARQGRRGISICWRATFGALSLSFPMYGICISIRANWHYRVN